MAFDLKKALKARAAKPKPKKRIAGRRRPGQRSTKKVKPIIDEAQARIFCHEYLFKQGFNATKAYRAMRGEVGVTLTQGSAWAAASKLLASPFVQKMMAEMIQRAFERHELDEDYIIRNWIGMAQANIMHYFEVDDRGVYGVKDLSTLPEWQQQNVTQLEVDTDRINDMVVRQKVRVKVVDRRAANDSMARAAGLFGERDEDAGSLDKLIQEAAERVRAAKRAMLIDGKTGKPVAS